MMIDQHATTVHTVQYVLHCWAIPDFTTAAILYFSLSKISIYTAQCTIIIVIIVNPLTARVAGAPQMILQPVFSIFPCSMPAGTCQTPGLSIPNVVFPPLPLSALSYSPFHCALQDGFGQTWWTGNMTITLQFASLYDRQKVFVWSNCLLDLGTSLYEMCSILR